MTTPHVIRLKSTGRYDERVASGIFKPGHLVKVDSNGKVLKHSTYGGFAQKLIALEDALQGKVITDAYAVGDIAGLVYANPGDVLLTRLPAAAPAVVVGDALISNGDGTLIKSPNANQVLYDNVAASAAVSNGVTTEQFFDKSYSLPANFLQVGDVIKIKGWAVVSAHASTDTLTVKLYLGTVTIVTTAAVDAAVGDIVWVDATVIVRTIGATGTVVAAGTQGNGVPGTVTAKPFFLASTTLDSTIASIIRASATWSATSATNTVALQGLTVEIARAAGDGRNVLAIADEAVDNSAGVAETFLRACFL